MRRTGPLMFATIALLAAVCVPLAGCAGSSEPPVMVSPPDRLPEITGVAVSVDRAKDQSGEYLGSIEVSGSGRAYDRAVAKVTKSTGVFLIRATSSGPPEVASLVDIGVGDTVDVWFTGPVAESYPVQTTAEAVALHRPE